MMLEGSVNHLMQAVVPVRLYGPNNQFEDVSAMIDTGFSGALVVPVDLVQMLGLDFVSSVLVELADGTIKENDRYEAEVDWMGRRKLIAVTAVECDTLLGMKLLAGHQLFIDVRPGGKVEIQ